jgi:hypothetical protein
VSVVIIPRAARPVIPTHKYARNGKPVLSDLQQLLAERIGQAATWRQPEVFGAGSVMNTDDADTDSQLPASTSGTRTRWRFAFRAHPYALQLWVRFYVAPPTPVAAVPYVTVKIYSDTLLTALVGEARTYSYATGSDVPSAYVSGEKILEDWTVSPRTPITLTPGAEYFGVVEDHDYARCIAVSVRTAPLASTTENGWPATTVAGGGPVLDADRNAVAVMARAIWQGHAAKLVDWAAGVDAEARTLAGGGAYTNIIDGTTSASDDTAGFSLALSRRSTIGRTKGVPVRLRVFAAGTVADTGEVRVVEASGTVMFTVACDGGTARWYHVDSWLPAADAKYDLQVGGNGSSLTVYAATIYERNHDEPVYAPPVPTSSLAPMAALLTGAL